MTRYTRHTSNRWSARTTGATAHAHDHLQILSNERTSFSAMSGPDGRSLMVARFLRLERSLGSEPVSSFLRFHLEPSSGPRSPAVFLRGDMPTGCLLLSRLSLELDRDEDVVVVVVVVVVVEEDKEDEEEVEEEVEEDKAVAVDEVSSCCCCCDEVAGAEDCGRELVRVSEDLDLEARMTGE